MQAVHLSVLKLRPLSARSLMHVTPPEWGLILEDGKKGFNHAFLSPSTRCKSSSLLFLIACMSRKIRTTRQHTLVMRLLIHFLMRGTQRRAWQKNVFLTLIEGSVIDDFGDPEHDAWPWSEQMICVAKDV